MKYRIFRTRGRFYVYKQEAEGIYSCLDNTASKTYQEAKTKIPDQI